MSPLESDSAHEQPRLVHAGLQTTFCGTIHAISTPAAPIHHYIGIKYASIPARFRQSRLWTVGSYAPITEASKHGPICPQIRKSRSPEEMLFGIPQDEMPVPVLKQDEFECLNLNIVCPAGLTPQSKVPVMLWIHGGGDAGSGSEWYYDGGAIVRKSILSKKPVIFVTFNFRIGLLGFAASNIIRDDNKAAGEEGCGNYGLRDQRTAMEWLQANIGAFGGDPANITLLGSGSGAADIVCHLLSRHNLIHTSPSSTQPRLFARAIIQSPIFEPILRDVSNAGWMLSRVMSALQVTSMESFRKVEASKLLGLGQNLRVVDDGVWFREGWAKWFLGEKERGRHSHRAHHQHEAERHLSPAWQPRLARSGGIGVCSAGAASLSPPSSMFGTRKTGRSKSRSRSRSKARMPQSPSRPCQQSTPSPVSRPVLPHLSSFPPSTPPTISLSGNANAPLQPIIVGDSASDSLLWSLPISLWTSAGVVRRLKALCQSLSKTNGILRAYDIGAYTPDDEIMDRVLELVDDARVAWPTDVLAEAMLHEGNSKVWRYVFDQEGPARGIPHYGADLMYLFDWKPASLGLGSLLDHSHGPCTVLSHAASHIGFWEGPFDVDEEDEEKEKPFVSHNPPSLGSLSFEAALIAAAEAAAASVSASSSKIDAQALTSSIISLTPLPSPLSTPSTDSSPRSTDEDWLTSSVDRFAYLRVRDTMQEKWLAFSYGEEPWTPWIGHSNSSSHRSHQHTPMTPSTPSTPTTPTPTRVTFLSPPPPPEKVFIFGPEGETGERGSAIFDGRRRRAMWSEVLEPLGWTLVQKLGVELSRGPALGAFR